MLIKKYTSNLSVNKDASKGNYTNCPTRNRIVQVLDLVNSVSESDRFDYVISKHELEGRLLDHFVSCNIPPVCGIPVCHLQLQAVCVIVLRKIIKYVYNILTQRRGILPLTLHLTSYSDYLSEPSRFFFQ